MAGHPPKSGSCPQHRWLWSPTTTYLYGYGLPSAKIIVWLTRNVKSLWLLWSTSVIQGFWMGYLLVDSPISLPLGQPHGKTNPSHDETWRHRQIWNVSKPPIGGFYPGCWRVLPYEAQPRHSNPETSRCAAWDSYWRERWYSYGIAIRHDQTLLDQLFSWTIWISQCPGKPQWFCLRIQNGVSKQMCFQKNTCFPKLKMVRNGPNYIPLCVLFTWNNESKLKFWRNGFIPYEYAISSRFSM